jgi:hypothetical protein
MIRRRRALTASYPAAAVDLSKVEPIQRMMFPTELLDL